MTDDHLHHHLPHHLPPHLHWATELDRLELDLLRAERMLEDLSREGPGEWRAPLRLVGPIPADLRDRAVELSDRQRRVQAAMTTMLGALGRQHEFATRVDSATRVASVPVYLDLNA